VRLRGQQAERRQQRRANGVGHFVTCPYRRTSGGKVEDPGDPRARVPDVPRTYHSVEGTCCTYQVHRSPTPPSKPILKTPRVKEWSSSSDEMQTVACRVDISRVQACILVSGNFRLRLSTSIISFFVFSLDALGF
jgi:hypothetical protein